MSTTEQGSAFEERFHRILKGKLENRELGLDPECCTVYLRKAYSSRYGCRTVHVDVSIESHPKRQESWSLLWVWECKDYRSSSVSVGDIQEFAAKLDEISEKAVKGGVATTGPLQRGALHYAKAMHIPVLRVFPDDQVQNVSGMMSNALFPALAVIAATGTTGAIVAAVGGAAVALIGRQEQLEQESKECEMALTEAGFRPTNGVFYGVSEGMPFRDLGKLFCHRM